MGKARKFYDAAKRNSGKAWKATKSAGLTALLVGACAVNSLGALIHVDELTDFLTKDANAVSYVTNKLYDKGAVPTNYILAIGVKERDVGGNIIPTHVGGLTNDPSDPFSSANEASGWINPDTTTIYGLSDGEKADYWNCIKSSDKWYGWYNTTTEEFTLEADDTRYPNVPELNFEVFSQQGQPRDAGTINIPEPATGGFLALGAAGYLARDIARRKRRKAERRKRRAA